MRLAAWRISVTTRFTCALWRLTGLSGAARRLSHGRTSREDNHEERCTRGQGEHLEAEKAQMRPAQNREAHVQPAAGGGPARGADSRSSALLQRTFPYNDLFSCGECGVMQLNAKWLSHEHRNHAKAPVALSKSAIIPN